MFRSNTASIHRVRNAAVAATALCAVIASAGSAAADPAVDDGGAARADRVPTDDPTGGAYTSPTLLFIPAGAPPVWNARAILSTGTNWVGGDVNPDTGNTDFNLGLSPYAQARLHLFGSADGLGFQLGSSVTYKFVGFEGDPGECELAVSGQFRTPRFEVGLQGTAGKDFGSTDADVELHAYALYRVVPQLGLGAAGQARLGLVTQPGESSYDAVGGAIASFTVSRYQVGALAGVSTLGSLRPASGATPPATTDAVAKAREAVPTREVTPAREVASARAHPAARARTARMDPRQQREPCLRAPARLPSPSSGGPRPEDGDGEQAVIPASSETTTLSTRAGPCNARPCRALGQIEPDGAAPSTRRRRTASRSLSRCEADLWRVE